MEDRPIHWSADQTFWLRSEGLYELRNNAMVHQPGESLMADFIQLDLKKRTIFAKGNCLYISSRDKMVIRSEEIYFNIDSKAGVVIRGQVILGGILLTGERINRLSESRFQIHEAEYTTCRDCTGTWSLMARDVSLEIEGYAHLSHVTGKVKDTPAAWFPYLIVPIKTERATGILFPRFGVDERYGFTFLLPFFWAISRNADLTLHGGEYTKRGKRLQADFQYLPFASGGNIVAGGTFQRDKAPEFDFGGQLDDALSRWDFRAAQSKVFPDLSLKEGLLFQEVSDNLYPHRFPTYVSLRGRSVLISEANFLHAGSGTSSELLFRRHRNMLNVYNPRQFDPKTVQLYPRAQFSMINRPLPFLGYLAPIGFSTSVHNFSRTAGPFDHDPSSTPGAPYRPGIDPIRKATRVSMTPHIFTSTRLFDVIAIEPQFRYKAYYYNFNHALPSLTRGYLHFVTDVTWQLERIYKTSNPDRPRIKHLIRPKFTYSRIPYIQEPGHPFLDQIKLQDTYLFDTEDVIPMSRTISLTNYFVPQGHSLEYSITNQLIRRMGSIEGGPVGYKRFFTINSGQAIDFLEFDRPKNERVPLTRFYTTTSLSLFEDALVWSNAYYYYPLLDRLIPGNAGSPHIFGTSLGYIIERTSKGFYGFERSFTLGYGYSKLYANQEATNNVRGTLIYSLSDYVSTDWNISYYIERKQFEYRTLGVSFKSPARCWKFGAAIGLVYDTPDSSSAYVQFDFALNLTGRGFGGLDEIYKRTQSDTPYGASY